MSTLVSSTSKLKCLDLEALSTTTRTSTSLSPGTKYSVLVAKPNIITSLTLHKFPSFL
ncbi:MAG: hypothetical protein LM583_01470 [Desulfurococcaceae archaeon]|nr:hypothetical protein [Desulfurococcaceae archaeon]